MRERTICRQQMMQDLMQVYREVVEKCPMGVTQTEVYQLVVQHPAPRFYIDPRRAHSVISPMRRGDFSQLNSLKPLKRQMYLDLFDEVQELSQQRGGWGKKLYGLLKEAVLEPAPRFYLSDKRMGQIWLEKVNETRKQRYRRIGKVYEKSDSCYETVERDN